MSEPVRVWRPSAEDRPRGGDGMGWDGMFRSRAARCDATPAAGRVWGRDERAQHGTATYTGVHQLHSRPPASRAPAAPPRPDASTAARGRRPSRRGRRTARRRDRQAEAAAPWLRGGVGASRGGGRSVPSMSSIGRASSKHLSVQYLRGGTHRAGFALGRGNRGVQASTRMHITDADEVGGWLRTCAEPEMQSAAPPGSRVLVCGWLTSARMSLGNSAEWLAAVAPRENDLDPSDF